MMKDNVSCVILAGGKNVRMGRNKALLKVGDKTIIEIINEVVEKIFTNIIVVSNEPDQYSFLNKKVVSDIYPGRGPISGIHTGLIESSTERNFFISCDLPLVPAGIIEYIINYSTNKPITIPTAGNYLQTLCAVYDKSCLPVIEHRLNKNVDVEGRKQKRFSLIDLMQETGAEIVDVSTLPFYDDKIFFNLNNMNDYEKIKQIIGSGNGS